MKTRSRLLHRCLATLAVGLLVALPVLGIQCEVACAGTGAAASASEPVPTGHCPAHEDPRGSTPADAPAPDRCGHHAESPAVKAAIEVAGARHLASTVVDIPSSASTLPLPGLRLAQGAAPVPMRILSSRLARVLRL